MELDGLRDADGLMEADGLIEADGLVERDVELDGLLTVTTKEPAPVNVWIVLPPLVVIDPPVADVNDPVG